MLSDDELNVFQTRCFAAPLQAHELSGIKTVVSKQRPEVCPVLVQTRDCTAQAGRVSCITTWKWTTVGSKYAGTDGQKEHRALVTRGVHNSARPATDCHLPCGLAAGKL